MTVRSLAAPRLAMPWSSPGCGYSLPGSLLLTMALGEAPEEVPSSLDVRRGCCDPATHLDGGPVDRILRNYAGASKITRVHAAAASLYRPSARHLKFDDAEQVTGVARTFRVDVPKGTAIERLVNSLNQVSTVEAARPNYLCATPFEAPAADVVDRDTAWATRSLIRAPEAMAYEPGDPAIIIAIIDSGVAPDHPELTDRLRAGYDTVQLGLGDVASGISLLGDNSRADADPTDSYVGHGMACAGIIGAMGVDMPPGLAGRCQLLPLRALGAAVMPGRQQAVGLGAISDIDMAMKLAVDLGAKVINMSFGTDDAMVLPHLPKPHSDVVAYAVDRGCILVAASGNNGKETTYWPAAFPEVIATAAVDVDGKPTIFSTRGDHVALSAPGEKVLTAAISGYQSATGTSFAAPFVTAAAALLVSRAQARATPIASELVKELLIRTAAPFSGGSAAGCGAGVLDVLAALQQLDETIDQSLSIDTGQVEDG
jgi:subtilisin family serine protease